MTNSELTFEPNEFIEDKAVWVAYLSDNTKVYMDNGNPAFSEYSAWLRLKKYLMKTKLKINKLSIKFRAREIYPIPDNAEGYFFRNSVYTSFGKRKPLDLFLIGYLKDNNVIVQEWHVPTLTFRKQEVRDVNNSELVGESLIKFNEC